VNHIDTSDFYGPHVTNQIIKQALYPHSDGLVIVSKVGFRRGTDKSWLHAVSRQELIDAVHDNLRHLGLDTLDLVNLRVGGVTAPTEGSIEEPLTVLAELKRQGLIRLLGVSNVIPEQLAEAQKITVIAWVQNFYNVANRNDDAFIDRLAKEGIAYVPFFRWEDSRRYSHRCSIRSQCARKLLQCRSRLPGFFSVLPTFC
jgi:aryl-alcohol dehydrogenase-like predicted oxidoreductase